MALYYHTFLYHTIQYDNLCRQWDTDVWVADNRKIQDSLGWKPCHDFESGFRATVSWFKTNSRLLKFYEAGTAS